MTETELAGALLNKLDGCEIVLSQMLGSIDKIGDLTSQINGLANQVAAASAVLADSPDEEKAEVFLEAQLAPLHEALDEIDEALGPAFLQLSWNEDVNEEADTVSGDARQSLVIEVDEVFSDMRDQSEDACDDLVSAISDARTNFDALIHAGDVSAEEVTEACDALISVMENGIPDLGNLVNKLVGESFNSQLTELTGNITNVLDQVEALVDSAGGDLIGRIEGVADVISEINEIVQPLKPAFDAFEVLT